MESKTRRPDVRAGGASRLSITERVMAWPRYGRLLLVFLSVVMLAFALQGVVGELYVRVFEASIPLSTLSWIVAAICLGMYGAGYVFIIGSPGVRPPAGRAQSIYLLATAVLVVVSVVWLVVRTAAAVS